MLCGQHLLQEIAKCPSVISSTVCRAGICSGVALHSLQGILCSGAQSTSFLPSSLALVPHSIFYPPLLPECWFCLFLNMLPQRHRYLSQKVVSGPAAPHCQSIVMNTSSFCLFIFFYFPFLSPLSFYFPIFYLCFLYLLSSLFFSQCLLSFSPVFPTFIL